MAEQKDATQGGGAPAEQVASAELSPSLELLSFTPTDPDPLETAARAYYRAVLAVCSGIAGDVQVWR